jgi:hypothetical protein
MPTHDAKLEDEKGDLAKRGSRNGKIYVAERFGPIKPLLILIFLGIDGSIGYLGVIYIRRALAGKK